MDFRLHVFITCAKKLNYSLCAKELGISQPAVSKHIKELEKECGVQLFAKVGNKLKLTYEGDLLLDKAIRIDSLYSSLREDSSLISKAPKGSFSLVVPPPIYYGFLPAFIGEFCRLAIYSSIDIHLNDSESLQNDKSIVINYSSSPLKEEETLFTDQLVVVGGAGFSKENYYDLNELKLLHYKNDPQTNKDILDFFASSENNPQFDIIANLNDSQAIIRLLLSYQKYSNKTPKAVAFLWKSQVSKFLRDRKLQIVNISDIEKPLPKRWYSIQYPNTKENIGFVDFLKNWIKNLNM